MKTIHKYEIYVNGVHRQEAYGKKDLSNVVMHILSEGVKEVRIYDCGEMTDSQKRLIFG